MRTFDYKVASGREDREAVLECYLMDQSPMIRWKNRPAVIICAGGAYSFTNDRESEPIAMMFLSKGFQSFSLRYSCEKGIYPDALVELAKAVLYVRQNAEEFHVDPKRIVVAGFSAGGHLAAEYCCRWNQEEFAHGVGTIPDMLRPNLLALGYPVITGGAYTHEESMKNLLGDQDSPGMRQTVSVENLVTNQMPPTFLWHTRTDPSVSVFNSLLLAEAMTKAGVPYELHIYPYGGHGLSLSSRCTTGENRHINHYCADWVEELDKFMEEYLNLREFDREM